MMDEVPEHKAVNSEKVGVIDGRVPGNYG